MTLVNDGREDCFQRIEIGTMALGSCSGRERLGSTPNTAWVSGNLQPRAGCGSLYGKLYGNNSDKGKFCLNRPNRSLAEGRAG